MHGLRRHQLAHLSAEGWSGVLQRAWEPQAQAFLAQWANHGLPLVVTRQPSEYAGSGRIALGLPSALAWGKLRLAVQVPWTAVQDFAEFPALGAVLALLPTEAKASAAHLQQALDACGVTARVFGSYGWQALSGLPYVRPESDLDLCIGVDGMAQADAVVALLQAQATPLPRIDGELMFADGAAVAWREWAAWRGGRARALLVRHLERVGLEHDAGWCAPRALQETMP